MPVGRAGGRGGGTGAQVAGALPRSHCQCAGTLSSSEPGNGFKAVSKLGKTPWSCEADRSGARENKKQKEIISKTSQSYHLVEAVRRYRVLWKEVKQ